MAMAMAMAIRGELKLYNPTTREKEVFKPIEEGKVGMYVCGINASDYSHLGHARVAVCFDVLYRYLKYLGYNVTYVRNFTDIDDKIIQRAKEAGFVNPLDLSSEFIEEYLTDMDALQCLRPTHQPKVSDHIDQIKVTIDKILDNRCAYFAGDEQDEVVYFDVERVTDYGHLSGLILESSKPCKPPCKPLPRGKRKDYYADFPLWKPSNPGEHGWESEWCHGRPGWNIQCSAMSAHYLTPKFDIHGGGIDLRFPHHANVYALNHAAFRYDRVGYWMYIGHVTITNNNEKFPKLLGNLFKIREVTERYHPLALRHFLISAHYRSPLSYTSTQLERSSHALLEIYQTLQDCEDALSLSLDDSEEGNAKPARITPAAQDCISKLCTDFQTKLSDDLSTSHVLTGTCFQEALKLINIYVKSLKNETLEKERLSMVQSLVELEKQIEQVLDVLGLLSPPAEVLQQLKDTALKRAGFWEEEDISRLVAERAQIRRGGDFARSDKIRADLKAKGIALMDPTAKGIALKNNNETIWRPCLPESA